MGTKGQLRSRCSLIKDRILVPMQYNIYQPVATFMQRRALAIGSKAVTQHPLVPSHRSMKGRTVSSTSALDAAQPCSRVTEIFYKIHPTPYLFCLAHFGIYNAKTCLISKYIPVSWKRLVQSYGFIFSADTNFNLHSLQRASLAKPRVSSRASRVQS
jgi:hypothetical protein